MIVLSVVVTAFVLVLPVELPDKTLFASLVLATRFPPLPVFVGVGTAFGLQVAIAVTAGSLLSLLPEVLVAGVVAVLFLVGAVLLWRSAAEGPEDGGEAQARERTSFLRAAAVSFGVLFAAEWGDLSQLLTISLVAKYDDPASVFLGAWGALLAVSGLAVIVGRLLLQRIRLSLLHYVGATVCVFMAALTVWEMTR